MKYFNNYISRYDLKLAPLNYKFHHSYRVMKNMEYIAKKLNLSKKDIELAKCIGLLHDIGRFDQYTLYQSFDDVNLDHGTYGEKLIKAENMLINFNVSKDDYEIVYDAIRNHNKYVIESNLEKRSLFFSKMIRDADKLDILYALGNRKLVSIFHEDDSIINKVVTKSFYKRKLVKNNDTTTKSDNIISFLAYPYDINFNVTLEYIKEKKLYKKIYNRLKYKDKYKEYLEYIEAYIDERIEKDAR